jgi:hypothetical protein
LRDDDDDDDDGRFVKTYAKRSEGSPLIVEAEALSVFHVLSWLQSVYTIEAHIATGTDCLQVVQAIKSKKPNNTSLEALFKCIVV